MDDRKIYKDQCPKAQCELQVRKLASERQTVFPVLGFFIIFLAGTSSTACSLNQSIPRATVSANGSSRTISSPLPR